jgi:hypothetical protein
MESKHTWDVLAGIMEASPIWIAIAAILVVAELWAVTRVMKSDGKRDSKGLWIIVLIFIPLLGLLAWAFVGPKVRTSSPSR